MRKEDLEFSEHYFLDICKPLEIADAYCRMQSIDAVLRESRCISLDRKDFLQKMVEYASQYSNKEQRIQAVKTFDTLLNDKRINKNKLADRLKPYLDTARILHRGKWNAQTLEELKTLANTMLF